MTSLSDVFKAAPKPDPPAEPVEDIAFDIFSSRASSRPVGTSPDFRRIETLPRRVLSIPNADRCETFSAELRRKGGTRVLRPLQVAALVGAKHEGGGLLAPLGVGEGKTDICALLPEVLGARVTLMLLPAQLVTKFTDIEYPFLSTQWKLPNLVGHRLQYTDTDRVLHVMSYDGLSRAKATDLLERLKPDLFVLDEAHRLAAPTSVRTKRWLRYMKAHPDVKVCALSGSITKKSIRDYAHISKHALKHRSPLPLDWKVLQDWAGALDSGDIRTPPGVLSTFSQVGEDVREGFKRRLLETEGVVASSAENKVRLPTALILNQRELPLPEPIKTALSALRGTWCTPGGEEIQSALDLNRYGRQLAAGLYLKWKWPRNEPIEVRKEWLEARKEWHKEVRTWLKAHARDGLDSPLLVARAAALGTLPGGTNGWHRWAAIRDAAKPQTTPVWVDDYMINDAVAWGRDNVGIIWYEHEALGARIAERGGFALYGGGPRASLDIQREDGRSTVVASIKAHGEGKNLQAFNCSLVTTAPSSGKTWEQKLGRMHRPGQEADEVNSTMYLHTPEMLKAFGNALKDAQYFEQTIGAEQRLSVATYTFDKPVAEGIV